jgi:hypothetical protein
MLRLLAIPQAITSSKAAGMAELVSEGRGGGDE